jgi:hypothetical protein
MSRNKRFSSRFEYHMFYVLYPFVTVPHIKGTKFLGLLLHQLKMSLILSAMNLNSNIFWNMTAWNLLES